MSFQRIRMMAGLLCLLVLVLSGSSALGQTTESSPPLLGVNYGPFRNEQSPEGGLPTPEQIAEDMALIAQKVSAIRLYSMVYGPQDSPQNLGEEILAAAGENGLKVVIQAWIGTDLTNNTREIAAVIDAANRYGNVAGVLVGSEVLLRGDLSADELIQYIQQVRQAVPGDIPVGYADDFTRWNEHPEVAAAVDWIGLHSYGFFSCQTVEQSPAFTIGQWGQMLGNPAFSSKPIILFETGWPTSGSREGCSDLVLDEAAQQQFVQGMIEMGTTANLGLFLFEFADEPWKCYTGGEGTFGCHWGLVNVDRTPKPAWDVLPTRTSPQPSVTTIQTSDQSPADCRIAPGKEFPAAVSLVPGTEVSVLNSNADQTWLFVQAGEQQCWVESQVVSGAAEVAQQTEPTPTEPPSGWPSSLLGLIEQVDQDLCKGDPRVRWEADVQTAASCVRNFQLNYGAQATIQQGKRTGAACELPPAIVDKTSYFADYWALADAATVYFILAQKLVEAGQPGLALEAFETILEKYNCAWAWDEPTGEFWWVAQGARHELVGLGWVPPVGPPLSGQPLSVWIESADPNLCPEIESQNMVRWDGDLPTVAACMHNLRIWNVQAAEQQNARLQFGICDVQPQPVEKDSYFEANWALTDVGTGYFVLGKKLREAGEMQLAGEAFQTILDQYSCGWGWDTQGFFWSLAEGARNELATLPSLEDGTTSATCPDKSSLANWIGCGNADQCPGAQSQNKVHWEANLTMATDCALGLQTWAPQATEQQNARQLSGTCDVQPQPVEKDSYFADNWALTDVGTGYFVLGKQLKQVGEMQLACEAFQTILDQYSCAWVWDPQGWFWSLAEGARGEMGTSCP